MKNTIIQGDCREGMRKMPPKFAHTCITSPPYFGLRDYGHAGQIGLEQTPDEYVQQLVEVFREVRRVLRDDGTVWLNLGDSYAGSGKGVWNVPDSEKANVKETYRPTENPVKTIVDLPAKNLIGIPWRVAFALQADGWILRQDIIWHKPNPMPESVTDRCTKAHEYIFLFSKQQKYYYDADAIKEPCVWDTGGMTEKRTDRAHEDHKAMPTVLKNGIRPKKKGPQTFGGSKAREGQESGGDPRNGHRAEENSQWGKVWDSENTTRNKRSVWTVATKPYAEAHFATFPPELITPCILAGCPEGGIVLDPFMGSGTVAATALRLSRNYLGCELNPDYIALANNRIYSAGTMFTKINFAL